MSRNVAAAAPARASHDDSTLASALCSYFRDSHEEAEADPLQVRALQSGMLCSELSNACFSDNPCSQGMWLEGDSLAPFVVTPMANVLRALELANVSSEDTLLDVGCGDGRVVVAAAALRGATARGVELEAHVAATAQRAVERWAVESA